MQKRIKQSHSIQQTNVNEGNVSLNKSQEVTNKPKKIKGPFCFHLASWNRFNFIEHFETVRHFSKNRMLLVKMASRLKGDEKLRSIRIGTGIGHAQDPTLIVLQLITKLVLERTTPTTLTTATWTENNQDREKQNKQTKTNLLQLDRLLGP